MRFRFRFYCLLGAILQNCLPTLLPAQNAKEEPAPIYRAGGLSFVIPAPSADLVEPGSDYRVLLEPFAPSSNRLIAAFIPTDQISVLHEGNIPQPQQCALVEVMRVGEFRDIDSKRFEQVAAGVGKQFEPDSGLSLKSGEEELNRNLKSLGSTNPITLDKPIPLGTFFSKPDACGFGIITPASSTKDGPLKMTTAVNVMRLHNRLIFTYLYAVYKDESTLAWLKTADEQWVDTILKANK
jgi:hypothetical protein